MDLRLSLGNRDAPILILLDAPSKDDIEAGQVLSGYLGNMVLKHLDPAQVQAVALLDAPAIKAPTKTVALAALEQWRADAATRTPRIVIPMGSLALWACMGDEHTSVIDWRGYFIAPMVGEIQSFVLEQGVYKSSRKPSAKHPGYSKGDPRMMKRKMLVPSVLPPTTEHVLPTITPQMVQKTGLTLLSVLRGDLKKTEAALRPGFKIEELEDFKFDRACPTTIDAKVVVDIETTWTHQIECIGVGDANQTASVGNWNTGEMSRLLTNSTTIIAHNAAFDFSHLRKQFNIDHVRLWDTMLAAYMLHPDGKKSLNWVISQYLNVRRHKHLGHEHPELYNALDVRRTQQIYTKLREGLHFTGQLKFFEEGMMPAIPTLVGMSERGLQVDVVYSHQWMSDLANEYYQLCTTPGAGIATQAARVARHFGLKNSNEESLLKLKLAGHPESEYIDRILRIRDLVKNMNTYAVRGKDVVNPSYLPGTRDTDTANSGIAYSGRPTASKPNIQNQPLVARRQFIPGTGKIFVSLDWSQIEPRITAALSGDDNLSQDIEAGLYDSIAAYLSCPRSVAKMVVLMSAYLGSPRTLKDKLMLNGIHKSYEECKQLQAKMFSRYAKWGKWRDRIIRRARADHYLTNPFGKRAPFMRPHPAKAVNFMPQSTAACILWYCLPQVEKAIAPLDATITTTVHDEILMECAPDKMNEVVVAAKEVMEQKWDIVAPGFSVPTKAKFGSNWADMLEVDSPWSVYERKQ